MEYYSVLKKDRNPVICNNMDEPREHYAKWNNPDRKKLILYMASHKCDTFKKKNWNS